MKIKNILLSFVVFSFLVHCASQADSTLEEAQFELDQGNYDRAIELATDSIAEDPSNIAAYRILGSAYFGRSNFDFLDIEETMLNLDENDVSNFQAIANSLPSNGSLDDLRSAIAALESAPGITDATIDNEELADAAFDMALMKAIEHYAVGVYGSNFHTALDVTGITDDQATRAQTDLIDFDGNFIASGVDDSESFLSEIRQTFCMLEPISATDGFLTVEYQALVGCQLDPDNFDPTTVTAAIANCGVLDPGGQTADVQACYDADTAL